MEIILATTKKGETTIADPVVDAVIKATKENQIDVLIIDPFVSSHRVTEIDNNVIETFREEMGSHLGGDGLLHRPEPPRP